MTPPVSYAVSSDGTHIAWLQAGDGPLDVLYVPTWISQCEHLWAHPPVAHFFERIASFSRLIMFARAGPRLLLHKLGRRPRLGGVRAEPRRRHELPGVVRLVQPLIGAPRHGPPADRWRARCRRARRAAVHPGPDAAPAPPRRPVHR